jgi:excisionase family DNA binding protein
VIKPVPPAADYLTTEQVAELLQVSVIKLAQDRMRGRGLPYFRLGRTVRYARAEIESYLAAHGVLPRK